MHHLFGCPFSLEGFSSPQPHRTGAAETKGPAFRSGPRSSSAWTRPPGPCPAPPAPRRCCAPRALRRLQREGPTPKRSDPTKGRKETNHTRQLELGGSAKLLATWVVNHMIESNAGDQPTNLAKLPKKEPNRTQPRGRPKKLFVACLQHGVLKCMKSRNSGSEKYMIYGSMYLKGNQV